MEISEKLKPLADDLNNPLIKSMQHSFSKHIDSIEACKSFGMSEIVILEKLNALLDKKITKPYLNTLIARARRNKKIGEKNTVAETVILTKKNNEIEKTIRTNDLNINEWKTKTPVSSERLVRKLTEAGYSIEDVQSWNCPNEMQITNRLMILGDKK